MLLQILVERHRLEYHFLVQLRGVQQVKPVVLPYSEAQMGNVEPRLLTGDGDDVAVVDGLAQQLAFANVRLRDESELEA